MQISANPGPNHADKLQCSAAVPTRGNGCGFTRGRWRFQLECAGQLDARKLLGLSVNARWEADQTGALQDSVRAVLDTNTLLFVSLLNKLTSESEQSVWSFLFGAPHPSNEPLSRAVRKQVCDVSARSCKLSNYVYLRAVSNEHNH